MTSTAGSAASATESALTEAAGRDAAILVAIAGGDGGHRDWAAGAGGDDVGVVAQQLQHAGSDGAQAGDGDGEGSGHGCLGTAGRRAWWRILVPSVGAVRRGAGIVGVPLAGKDAVALAMAGAVGSW